VEKNFIGRDIISLHDFSREEILFILAFAQQFENLRNSMMSGRILATCFYEPSTRTRLSFESAMFQLGGDVIGFDAGSSSSAVKGETVADTAKMIEGYADVMVIRHPQEGSARVAGESSTIPVINGGDGANQHPTQTFLDLYTILKTKGTLSNLKIGFIGDLKYGRTVHSLAEALTHFNSSLYFISPTSLRMPSHILSFLTEHDQLYYETTDLYDYLFELDIVYVTRIQKERFFDSLEYEKVKNSYVLDKRILKTVKQDLKILHPLPRVNEIDSSLDSSPQAEYFQQSKNGVTVRKALLSLVLGIYP